MPQIESQKKRVLTTRKATAANKRQKSSLRTTMSNLRVAVEERRKDDAVAYFNRANELLDKSITSNIHHPNYVSRQKSTLAKLINTI